VKAFSSLLLLAGDLARSGHDPFLFLRPVK
jgi:hypothetical protein